VLIIGAYVTYLKIETYHEVRNKIALTTLNGIASVFENVNNSISEVLLTYSEVDVFKKTTFSAQDQKDIRNLLYEYSENSALQDVAFGAANGQIFSRNEALLPDDYDPRFRPWYMDATNAGDEIVISSPYRDATDPSVWSLTYALQVTNDDGKVTGVLGTDLKLQGLETYFNKYFKQFDGSILVLDENSSIIIEKVNGAFTLSNKEEIIFQFIRQDGLNIPVEYEDISYKMDKLTVSDMDWSIILLTPSSRETEDLMKLLTPLFIVFLLVFAFMNYFFKEVRVALIAPLESVSEQIDEINVEEFPDAIAFDFSIPQEMHVIKDAVNRMLDRIRKQTKELQDQKQEINGQYEEIEALYEETTAMNDSLSDLVDEIQESYKTTIYALSSAIEANDAYTKGHCDRVKEYSLKLGGALNLSASELQTIEYAAILHDIGKVGIPSDVLNKPAKLTKDEYMTVCKHPEVGGQIIQDIPYLQTVKTIVEQHHERVDGTGYPKGLVEKEIHPFAQILCITDAYDAMTSKRPYRTCHMTKEEAIEELIKCSGTQFSQRKVNIFIEILQNEEKNGQ
jgi:HD-GYP domain-containing protein (c-di-GMP phosphodiesterase class II)